MSPHHLYLLAMPSQPCYRDHTGRYQDKLSELQGLVPNEGTSEIPHIEALRVMSNAYHDWYCNGFGNKSRVKDLLRNAQVREAAQSNPEAIGCLDFLQNAWASYQEAYKEWNAEVHVWDCDDVDGDYFRDEEPYFYFPESEDYSLEPGTFGAKFEALTDAVILWAWNAEICSLAK